MPGIGITTRETRSLNIPLAASRPRPPELDAGAPVETNHSLLEPRKHGEETGCTATRSGRRQLSATASGSAEVLSLGNRDMFAGHHEKCPAHKLTVGFK